MASSSKRPDAGGHNAPPRGKLRLDEAGQPVYGPRDAVDFDEFAVSACRCGSGGYSTAQAVRVLDPTTAGRQAVGSS